MEAKGIHYLTAQEYSVQRTYFMHNDNSFSLTSSSDPEPEDPFDNFSSSEVMQVGRQECSKRPFTIDRDVSIPPKKRKQLPEELYLCDVSSYQYLQKSESNDGINIAFMTELENKNLHQSTSNANHIVDKEGQINFNLQSSVYVKADDSTEWIRLKCFDSIILDESNGATFFAGGPIQSSAFSTVPHDLKENQYIAIAVNNAIHNNHSLNNTKNMNGIIQFWNFGSLHERKTLNQRPLMEFALCHDNGIITQMKWCPANCYDKYPTTCHLPRLGLLAASSSDSCIYIYNVPRPDFMPKLELDFPTYYARPSMKLVPLFGGPSSVTRKAVATCIDWEETGERIVAGYGSGAVCVWMIKISFTLSTVAKSIDESYVIQPYLFFEASGAPIESLSFAPFGNHRWLAVLSMDKCIRVFDLHDTPASFQLVRQVVENSFTWAEAFCGVYSSTALNSLGLISLSAKDYCGENKKCDNQKGAAILFDSSAHVAVSGNKKIHAIADMSGRVTVNFLANIRKPQETSYITYMILETKIMALDSVDLDVKTSESKLNITGNIPSNKITSISDAKSTLCAKIKQGSSSSSSSGFCSPKRRKTIVIETDQCFGDNIVNLQKSPPGSSVMHAFKDFNNNNRKQLNSEEDTFDEMIKCSELSEDLMHDLLMVKIANLSKSSSCRLAFNTSNNSAFCDSKGAKYLSELDFTSPAASNYTGDTIVYPLEPCFCDTSHPNATKSSDPNAQVKNLGLKEKENTFHETTMHRMNGKLTLPTELFAKSSLNLSSCEIKPGNSHTIKNTCSTENSNLNYKNRNLRNLDYFGYDHNSIHSNNYHHTSKPSDMPRKEYSNSEKSKKGIKESEVNLDSNSNLISKKDAMNLPFHKSFDDPLSYNSNQLKPLPDVYSSETKNDLNVCDRDGHRVSARALNQSATPSDYSGDTVIYSLEPYDCNKTDENYLNAKEPGANSQSLYNSEKKTTFQDNLLLKIDEDEPALCGSKAKFLTENRFSISKEKCENFITKKSQKYDSEYDSATQSYNSSEENRNFYLKDCLISDFHLLHSEYLFDKSEDKHPESNKLPKSGKHPQNLSYENLTDRFGVIFKKHLDKSAAPLNRQENEIYINNNPLSVIKTICWDPNEGCESWMFLGGNSGICHLIYVPDFAPDTEMSRRRRRKQAKCTS